LCLVNIFISVQRVSITVAQNVDIQIKTAVASTNRNMPLFIKTDLKFLVVVKVETSLLEMMFRLRWFNRVVVLSLDLVWGRLVSVGSFFALEKIPPACDFAGGLLLVKFKQLA
jgi:hypothetical protein